MPSVFTSKKAIAMGVVALSVLLMQIESFAGQDWEVVTQLPTKRTDNQFLHFSNYAQFPS